MSWLPPVVRLHVTDSDGTSLQGVVVRLKFFANHKNDYTLIPSSTDKQGRIEVSRSWVQEQIALTRNFFIADYASTLDDCKQRVEVHVLSQQEVEAAMHAMSMYVGFMGISERQMQELSKSNNREFAPISKIVEFRDGGPIQIEIVTQRVC